MRSAINGEQEAAVQPVRNLGGSASSATPAAGPNSRAAGKVHAGGARGADEQHKAAARSVISAFVDSGANTDTLSLRDLLETDEWSDLVEREQVDREALEDFAGGHFYHLIGKLKQEEERERAGAFREDEAKEPAQIVGVFDAWKLLHEPHAQVDAAQVIRKSMLRAMMDAGSDEEMAGADADEMGDGWTVFGEGGNKQGRGMLDPDLDGLLSNML